MKIPERATVSFVWLLLILVLLAGIYGGWQMTQTLWPGLHQDGAAYSTVAVNRASGSENRVDVYGNALLRHGGSHAFNRHGQLYYPLVASLMASPDYKGFLEVLHWSNLVACLLAFCVFTLASRRCFALPWLAASLFGLAGSYGMVAILHYLQGRPEHGIPLVLLAFMLWRELKGAPLPAWVIGLQVGVFGAMSPLAGIVFALYAVYAAGLRANEAGQLAWGLATMAAAAFASWVVFTAAVYDGSLVELVRNTFASGSSAYTFISSSHEPFPFFNARWFISRWFQNPFAPGLGFLYLAAAAVSVLLVMKTLVEKKPLLIKAVVCLAFILPLQQIWFSGFARPTLNYTFLVFFPAVSVWIFSQFSLLKDVTGIHFSVAGQSPWDVNIRLPKWFGTRVVPLALLVMVSLPAEGYLRTALMQTAILARGVSYKTALARFQSLKGGLRGNEKIFIETWTNPQSAVVFDGPPWSAMTYEKIMDGPLDDFEKKLGVKAKYYFYLQRNREPAPEIEGFRLIESNFNSTYVRVFGKWLRGSTPGYGYAVYERTEAMPEALQAP